MFQNHLFWMAVILFFLSAININVYLDYKKTSKVLPILIVCVGVFGMVAGLLRLIVLSLLFNWWWFVVVAGISLMTIGVLSHILRSKASFAIGVINILAIPLVWWYGSQLNEVVTFGWFYNIVESTKGFFS